jgi:hypothetical protein
MDSGEKCLENLELVLSKFDKQWKIKIPKPFETAVKNLLTEAQKEMSN